MTIAKVAIAYFAIRAIAENVASNGKVHKLPSEAFAPLVYPSGNLQLRVGLKFVSTC